MSRCASKEPSQTRIMQINSQLLRLDETRDIRRAVVNNFARSAPNRSGVQVPYKLHDVSVRYINRGSVLRYDSTTAINLLRVANRNVDHKIAFEPFLRATTESKTAIVRQLLSFENQFLEETSSRSVSKINREYSFRRMI